MWQKLLDWLFGSNPVEPPPIASVASTTGCWGLWKVDTSAPTHVLNSPYVTGLAVRIHWEFLEPSPKAFNWSYLDKVFSQVEGKNKKVSLNIIPGNRTPVWVFQQGAKAFVPGGIPIPWDSVYVAKWHRLIQALGTRYANRPSLVHVKLNGINHDGGELALPSSTVDTAQWMKLGYTYKGIIDNFFLHANAWGDSFPSQELVLPIQTSGLPKPQGENPVLSIVDQLRRWKHTNRTVLANHALSAVWVNPFVSDFALEGRRTGYQHKAPVTGEETFRMNNGTPGIEREIFEKAVNLGISAKGRYQEVYQGDIGNEKMKEPLQKLNSNSSSDN